MKQRIDIEWEIANRLVDDLLAAGFLVSVNDGEETVLENSINKESILDSMASTNEDFLHVTKSIAADHILYGWVRLVYGNGIDLISDYTTNLKEVMAGVDELWKKLETRLLKLSAMDNRFVDADEYAKAIG